MHKANGFSIQSFNNKSCSHKYFIRNNLRDNLHIIIAIIFLHIQIDLFQLPVVK